jgi:hypothetical protein
LGTAHEGQPTGVSEYVKFWMKEYFYVIVVALLFCSKIGFAQSCDSLKDISWCSCEVLDSKFKCDDCNFPIPREGNFVSWCGSVVSFVTDEDMYFLRFHNGTNPIGRWMVLEKDMMRDGKLCSYDSACYLLHLTKQPSDFIWVKIPAGTRMLEGLVDGPCTKLRQFCVERKHLNPEWYVRKKE